MEPVVRWTAEFPTNFRPGGGPLAGQCHPASGRGQAPVIKEVVENGSLAAGSHRGGLGGGHHPRPGVHGFHGTVVCLAGTGGREVGARPAGIRRLGVVCFRGIFSAARGMVDLGDDFRVYLRVLERVGALQAGER